MKIEKIKMVDGVIRKCYVLPLLGSISRTCYSMVIIPPVKKEDDDCPVVVFANKSWSPNYQYREKEKAPWINIDSKTDMVQFLKIYENARKKI